MTLPYLTQRIIMLSQFLRQYGMVLILLLSTLLIPLLFAKRYSPKLHHLFDRIVIHLPLLGSVIKKSILTRCLATISTLFAAGIPLTDCLTHSANIAANSLYKESLLAIRSRITMGERLDESMKQSTLFPPLVTQMVACGEQSGQLESVLNHVVAHYHSEIDQFNHHLNTLLEPIIMVILGGIMALLLIGVYLPIFQLGKTI